MDGDNSGKILEAILIILKDQRKLLTRLAEGQEASAPAMTKNTEAIYKFIEGRNAHTSAVEEMQQAISPLQKGTKEHTRAITILNATMEWHEKEIEKVIEVYRADVSELYQRVIRIESKVF